MLKMWNRKWEPHYSGIDVASSQTRWTEVYLQRDSRSKRLRYARVGIGRWWMCLFIGRLNFLALGEAAGGFELSTRALSIGISRPFHGVRPARQRKWWRMEVESHGNDRRTYRFAARIGSVAFGARLPAWISRRLKAHEERRWAAIWADVEANEADWVGDDSDH